jgi:hypothetical protein
LGRRVDLEVVSGVLVNGCRPSAGQACESVATNTVPFLGDLGRTPDADPHDVKARERNDPVVPTRLVDGDFVDNDL